MQAICVSELPDKLNLTSRYHRPIGRYGPSLDMMEQTLARLWQYGIPIPAADGPSDIWTLLLRQAPRYPMRVYAVAAACTVESICVAASEHTLEVRTQYLPKGEKASKTCLSLPSPDHP